MIQDKLSSSMYAVNFLRDCGLAAKMSRNHYLVCV